MKEILKPILNLLGRGVFVAQDVLHVDVDGPGVIVTMCISSFDYLGFIRGDAKGAVNDSSPGSDRFELKVGHLDSRVDRLFIQEEDTRAKDCGSPRPCRRFHLRDYLRTVCDSMEEG